MAEAAHLTSALGKERPSIFEVLAQESLLTTVRPALRHVVRVAAESSPARFSWILKYYNEIYTFLDLLLELHYLRKYSATFAENFYSLKRVSACSKSLHLSRSDFVKSLICVVLVPYIKQKLDVFFEDLRHIYNTSSGNKEMSVVSKAFVAIYPYAHTCWEGAILSYQTAYMFGKCGWHSPFLHLAGVTLCTDMAGEPESPRSNQLPWEQMKFHGKTVFLLKKLLNFAAVSISTSLSVGVFFIQFLDWWYANDASHTSLTSLPVPEPPARDCLVRTTQFKVCPICHRTRTNDTTLAVSGYVFCYPCIYDYVKEHKCCPLTKYPAKTEHLIKLFISGS